jgi:two-component system, OmpR family, sensor histidine kinase SenX3
MAIATLEQTGLKRGRAASSRTLGRPRATAAEPSKALVDALSIVVHDLRGPLANLQVMLDLIETYSERQALAEVPACARRAQDIIAALDKMLASFLERARLTGDPLAFRPALLDLNDVADEVEQLNRPLADARSLRIERHGGPPVTIEGDRQLLLEAVDNILGNAVKYSPAGSSINVTSRINGNDAVISITDSGPGLSPGDLAGLFRPFGRLANRRPEVGSSTGLGLWIARLIATRHGGTLTVRPREEAPGSVFTLRIPRWR